MNDQASKRENEVQPPKLVCFDLGGVMVRIVDSWWAAADRLEIPIESNMRTMQPWDHHFDLIHRLECGHIEVDQFVADASRLIGPPNREHLAAMLDAWLVELYPGVDRLIIDLHEAGVATGCLSNTNARHWQMMMHDGGPFEALHAIQHKHASHIAGCCKPDSGIYEHFEQATGLSGPEILFFDDREENVQAAGQRGWQYLQIDPTGDTATQMRHHLKMLNIELSPTS